MVLPALSVCRWYLKGDNCFVFVLVLATSPFIFLIDIFSHMEVRVVNAELSMTETGVSSLMVM